MLTINQFICKVNVSHNYYPSTKFDFRLNHMYQIFSYHWPYLFQIQKSFADKVRKNAGTSKFEYSGGPLGDVLRTSWGRPESTSEERPLNVGLEHPLNVISGSP